MGQKGSRNIYNSRPEGQADQQTSLKKAGSLSTLATHGRLTSRKEKSGSLRRTRSFTERQEEEEFQEKLRLQVEVEAKALNEWAHAAANSPAKLLSLASLAVASSLRTPLDIERLPCKRALKEQVEFMFLPVFDESIADPSVVFSNGGRSITYNGKSYSTTVLKTLLDQGLCNGCHAWIYYIENSRVQGWMQIGVVNKARWDTKCKTVWDGNPHPHRKGEVARRSNGNFHSGRDAAEATMVHESIFLGGYTKGDTIAIKLDCNKHEISWTRNGEPYGNSVSIPSEPVWPSVSLDSPGEAVSLVYYTCSVRSAKHRKLYHNESNNNTSSNSNSSINFKTLNPHPNILKKNATLDVF